VVYSAGLGEDRIGGGARNELAKNSALSSPQSRMSNPFLLLTLPDRKRKLPLIRGAVSARQHKSEFPFLARCIRRAQSEDAMAQIFVPWADGRG
jgi:hypothetical protein